MSKGYTHKEYGLGFKIECRLKTWKERNFWEKVLFFRQYKIGLLTDSDLFDHLKPMPKSLLQPAGNLEKLAAAKEFNNGTTKN